MRDIAELVDVPEPAWPWVTADLDCSFAHYTVLSPGPRSVSGGPAPASGDRQVTAGRITLNTGGILMHDGWLRIYGGSGAGPNGLPRMAEVNGFPAAVEPGWLLPAGLIIAHHVLGGVFTVNGMEPERHGRPGNPGGVVYFSPSTLAWQDLKMGHTEWLSWIVGDAASLLLRPAEAGVAR